MGWRDFLSYSHCDHIVIKRIVTHLRVPINGIRMRIRLVSPVALDIPHHAITAWQHGWSKRLLQLLFLLAVFGASVLKPHLRRNERHSYFPVISLKIKSSLQFFMKITKIN